PPNLVRLAMAEAAANRASYLSWPTWPEEQRERMIGLVRPEADFLKRNADLMGRGKPREDVILFLPFRRWQQTSDCVASRLAQTLSAANVPYGIICEDDLHVFLVGAKKGSAKVLLVESPSVFSADEQNWLGNFLRSGGAMITANKADWLQEIRQATGGSSIIVEGPSAGRAR